ncbi:unnamed protein product [Linum tenue]|uniref:Uncharacterized protein n=1 Tax=Linum tenue TaxID=586396 RepID=A0AAV0HTF6_9ROSI|nr:unnamed protein product [Linum tenue]
MISAGRVFFGTRWSSSLRCRLGFACFQKYGVIRAGAAAFLLNNPMWAIDYERVRSRKPPVAINFSRNAHLEQPSADKMTDRAAEVTSASSL